MTLTVTSRAPVRSRWNCPPFERWSSAFCLGTITSSRQTRVGNHPGSGGHNDFATPVHGELTAQERSFTIRTSWTKETSWQDLFTFGASAREASQRHAASEGISALLNRCEESCQMKGIAWVWTKADRWTSC